MGELAFSFTYAKRGAGAESKISLFSKKENFNQAYFFRKPLQNANKTYLFSYIFLLSPQTNKKREGEKV